MAVDYQGPADHEDWMVELAARALEAVGMSSVEVSLVLCDDATIRPLNRQWRGKDEVTDVLSFGQMDLDGPIEGVPDAPTGAGPNVLGDIVISEETAARQATTVGHSLREELVVLLVHGLAHLLGHTHDSPQSSDLMAAMELRLLRRILPGSKGLVARTGGPE